MTDRRPAAPRRRGAKAVDKPSDDGRQVDLVAMLAGSAPAAAPVSDAPAPSKQSSAATRKRAAPAPDAAPPKGAKPSPRRPNVGEPKAAESSAAEPGSAGSKPPKPKAGEGKPAQPKAVKAKAGRAKVAPPTSTEPAVVLPSATAPVAVEKSAQASVERSAAVAAAPAIATPSSQVPAAIAAAPSAPANAALQPAAPTRRPEPMPARRQPPPPPVRPPQPPVPDREPSGMAARIGIAPPGSAGRTRPVIAPPGSAGGRHIEGPAAAPSPAAPIAGRQDPPVRQGPLPPPAVSQKPRDLDPRVPLGRVVLERPRIAPAGSASAGPRPNEPADDGLGHVASAAMAVQPAGGAIRAPVDARTRKQRFSEGASEESAPPTVVLPQTAPVPERPRVGLMLVNRNHGALLADVWQRWREILPGFEVRAIVLDLGSVDESFDQAELARLEVVSCPGGLVTPVRSMLAGLRHAPAEIVLVADMRADPGAVGLALVELVRDGAAIAVAAGRQPGLLAIDTRKLRPDVADARNLAELAAQLDVPLRVGGVAELLGADAAAGLVPKLADGRRRAQLRQAAERWAERATRRLPGGRWLRALGRERRP